MDPGVKLNYERTKALGNCWWGHQALTKVCVFSSVGSGRGQLCEPFHAICDPLPQHLSWLFFTFFCCIISGGGSTGPIRGKTLTFISHQFCAEFSLVKDFPSNFLSDWNWKVFVCRIRHVAIHKEICQVPGREVNSIQGDSYGLLQSQARVSER